MHFIRGLRHRQVALAAIAIFAVAGGVAYAAIPDSGTGVYHACMLKNVGTIRIIDPERQRCSSSLEVEITFNKQGPTGDPGPTGPPGPPGRDGRDGTPFSGTFTSPNGQYSLSVADTGIVIAGPSSRVKLTSAGLELESAGDLTLVSGSGLTAQAGTAMSLQSGSSLTAQAGSTLSLAGAGSVSTMSLGNSGVGVQTDKSLTFLSDLGFSAQAGSTMSLLVGSNLTTQVGGAMSIQGGGAATLDVGGALSLRGSNVRLNGATACNPAARVADDVSPATNKIVSGSATVCIGG